MATADFIQNGNSLNFTNSSGSDMANGEIVVAGTKVFVTASAIANGATGAVLAKGVFAFPAVSTAIALGADVYYDATNKRVTTTASGNTKAGYCAAPCASGDTTCLVAIG